MLNQEERGKLRRYLAQEFSLAELTDIAFDLNCPLQHLPRETKEMFANELVHHQDQRRRLGCLVYAATGLRANPEMSRLLDKLPACERGVKLQIVLPQNSLEKVDRFCELLADYLGVEPEQMMLIAAAQGSLRLLVGVNEAVIDFQAFLQRSRRQWEQLPIISMVLFSTLKPEMRAAWRWIYEHAPSVREGDFLRPSIFWQEAMKQCAQPAGRQDESAVPPAPPAPPPSSSLPPAAGTINPPYTTMTGNPMPLPGHTRSDGRYQWFHIVYYTPGDFLPQIQPGDWVLADTRPEHDLLAAPEQLVLLMVDSQIDGTIPVIPHQSLPAAAHLVLARLVPQADGAADVAVAAELNPTDPPTPVPSANVLGVVVGSWRPVE